MLHQKRYVSDILKRFKMEDCNANSTLTEPKLQLMKDLNEEDVNPT